MRIAHIAKNNKARKVIVLDMRNLGSFCDFFVIGSGTSLRHVNALAGLIRDDLAKDKIKTLFRPSAQDESGWVVLDYADVVAHIFYEPVREFYALERLWADAKRVRIPRCAKRIFSSKAH